VNAVRQWVKGSDNHLQREIDLALLCNDIRLKYIPIPSNRDSQFAGKECGRYEALVTVNAKDSRQYGKTILDKPSNDWVEESFTDESLAIVQAVARETSKVYNVKGQSKTEHGFIPMGKELNFQQGAVELQISKMRWLPP
jgi:hypothetical protein